MPGNVSTAERSSIGRSIIIGEIASQPKPRKKLKRPPREPWAGRQRWYWGDLCDVIRSRSLLGQRRVVLTTVLQSRIARRRNVFTPVLRRATIQRLKCRHLLNHPIDTSLART